MRTNSSLEPGECPICLTDEDHPIPLCEVFTADLGHCEVWYCTQPYAIDELIAFTDSGFLIITRRQRCADHVDGYSPPDSR